MGNRIDWQALPAVAELISVSDFEAWVWALVGLQQAVNGASDGAEQS
jgi:hypothetical protein